MRYIKTFEGFDVNLDKYYASLDKEALEVLLEEAINNEDHELVKKLKDLIKSLNKEDKEEVITIEDWKKY